MTDWKAVCAEAASYMRGAARGMEQAGLPTDEMDEWLTARLASALRDVGAERDRLRKELALSLHVRRLMFHKAIDQGLTAESLELSGTDVASLKADLAAADDAEPETKP